MGHSADPIPHAAPYRRAEGSTPREGSVGHSGRGCCSEVSSRPPVRVATAAEPAPPPTVSIPQADLEDPAPGADATASGTAHGRILLSKRLKLVINYHHVRAA